ncbi:aldo/keto reductase [Marinomonas foliarum]|uniref:Aryl-alcohol dehydrogenase-like predicted oxidoreductase n=1 Tax=Marinomonas foliarum TaxID=491950 RepID=A0A369ACM7_9GAMM|nr:aldo/keto reductase [Marinomonas foliarum]RCX06921.1 aryl-alcohol dehydrogenase-like predicted oxidoreductase [Marinomonas foliarum]
MKLTSYRPLGHSGLIVSPLALGTMTFGGSNWGSTEHDAQTIFDAYREKGGNFIDTADIYGQGASEELLGKFIAESGSRDDIVLATKFGFNFSASPLAENKSARIANPNAGGSGAKNIHRALENSLKRLRTDYIDLYWMHIWDGVTPIEEILQTLGDLVRAGKIRYFAFSDMPAYIAMKAAVLASERRIPAPIAMQLEYSLVAREVEREHFPVARDTSMAVMPWSPLAGGFLTGKYSKEGLRGEGRLTKPNPFGDSKFSDRNWLILDALHEVASELEKPLAQVALAWTLSKPEVTSTIIGASSLAQLQSNIAALDIELTAAQLEKLNQASQLTPEFSENLSGSAIRKIVYGGFDVLGVE